MRREPARAPRCAPGQLFRSAKGHKKRAARKRLEKNQKSLQKALTWVHTYAMMFSSEGKPDDSTALGFHSHLRILRGKGGEAYAMDMGRA